MYENEGLVERAVASVTRLAERVTRAATLLLLATIVICVGSFWLGLEALSGGIESVWVVLGIFFGAIAIGCAVLARWRIGRVRKHVPEIAADMRSLVASGRSDVITIVIEDDQLTTGSAIDVSRGMSGMSGMGGMAGMRSVTAQSLDRDRPYAQAVRAITTFPLLAIGTILVTIVFAFLGLIFLIALAL